MTRKEYHRRWYKKNRKRQLANMRRYCNKNKKRAVIRAGRWVNKNKKRVIAYKRRWYKENKKALKKQNRVNRLKKVYGIDEKAFLQLRKAQNNRCAICKKLFRKSPHIDHSHDDGRIRGLLCMFCNVGLGMFKDSIFSLKNAIRYLWSK